MIRIPCPTVRGTTPAQQVEELRRYLCTLAELLNLALEEEEHDGKL